MNTKNVFKMLTIAAFAALTTTACNKSNSQPEAKESNSSKSTAAMKIAYVEVDSIMSQYKFCKDYSLVLQKKGQNIQNTLAAKQRALQSAAANFQQKVQQNAYTREQAEAIQAGLQKQNNDLQALNQRLTTEFQAETDSYNAALRDSIQHFLAVYNKDKKYSLILSKAGDNLLYVDKAFDITNEVVAGLNKAYKPSEKLEAAVKKFSTIKVGDPLDHRIKPIQTRGRRLVSSPRLCNTPIAQTSKRRLGSAAPPELFCLLQPFFVGGAPKLHPRLRSLPYLTAFSYSRLSRAYLLKHFIADKSVIIST